MTLAPAQIQSFITDGFIRIDDAFPSALAAEARAVFWNDLRNRGVRRDDSRTWREPVIRLGMYPQEALVAAANTPRLHAAFDELVGPSQPRYLAQPPLLPVVDNWLPDILAAAVPVATAIAQALMDTGPGQ